MIAMIRRAFLVVALGALTLGGSGLVRSAQAANFGAIAFSPASGAWGYSYDYNSRRSAEARALRECRARGHGCRVMVWFRNACGALAVGDGYGYGWAWAGSGDLARWRAMAECRARTRRCRVKALICTSR